jgi:tRNA A-37 threonylcarbamoyl transferase component Bud32
MRLQLVPHAGQPDFLDLPWDTPLAEWESERLVEVARGIGRNVVRFVEFDGVYFALKELEPRIAAREYRLLRSLTDRGIAVVEPVGIASDRHTDAGEELPAVLVTRYLDFSLPLRLLIARRPLPDLLDRLLDAVADLLVRLHLAGFFWGDCSLSNTLFRRDAGALAAHLVDAETGELHEELSNGQRGYDLQIAEENVFAELLDVDRQLGEHWRDPAELAAEVVRRYQRLWGELTTPEEYGRGERHRLDERLRRLNELGFDADEVELVATEAGYELSVRPRLVEAGHHRRRLLGLTGLHAQENQARRLLEDVAAYREALEQAGEPPVSETAGAGRWLAEIFEPTIAAVPAGLRAKRDAAQLFHEILEHRWYLSEQAGRDVGLSEATDSYVTSVLKTLPDERSLVGELLEGD